MIRAGTKAPRHKGTKGIPALAMANAALGKIVHGMEGAREYAEAIAAGDVCTKAVTEARRAHCRTCPSLVRTSLLGLAPTLWCGEPLQNNLSDPERPTCGCAMFTATMVASKECPQKRWGKAPRRTLHDLTREGQPI